jgi:uncharacterized protein YgiM (DUF1202 family)
MILIISIIMSVFSLSLAYAADDDCTVIDGKFKDIQAVTRFVGSGDHYFCPKGYFSAFVNSKASQARICSSDDGKSIYGPFTQAMINKCIKYGGGKKGCNSNRWAIKFALKIRGHERCPYGSKYSTKYKSCVDGKSIYGPFTKDQVQSCLKKNGGPACITMRWDISHAKDLESTPTRVDSNVPTGKVTAYSLNFRSGPSKSSNIISYLEKGDKLTILYSNGSWYKVKTSSGKIGYVSKKYISVGRQPANEPDSPPTPEAIAGYVKAYHLNVRSSPSKGSSILTAINKGSKVQILYKNGDWYKVKTSSGRTGYVSRRYISLSPIPQAQKPLSSVPGRVTASKLNVRYGAGREFRVKTMLKKNTQVSILSSSGSWYKIQLTNSVGWVHKDYIATAGHSSSRPSYGSSKYNGNTGINAGGRCIRLDISDYRRDQDFRKKSTQSFIDWIAPVAVHIQSLTGFPASVIIAQSAIESAWGRSSLFRKDKAPFGQSCWSYYGDNRNSSFTSGGVTMRYRAICGNRRPANEGGRYVKFSSYLGSIYAYIENLLKNPDTRRAYSSIRYHTSIARKNTRVADYKKIAAGLNHYAAASSYPRDVRRTIDKSRLYKYDKYKICD